MLIPLAIDIRDFLGIRIGYVYWKEPHTEKWSPPTFGERITKSSNLMKNELNPIWYVHPNTGGFVYVMNPKLVWDETKQNKKLAIANRSRNHNHGVWQRRFEPLPRAKFNVYRGNVSPLWGEKPIHGPLSKNNTAMAALRAGLPVKM